MCRTWTINLFPDLSGVTCRKWKLKLCFLRSFYCRPLQFIIDLVSDIWCLEGVNVKPRCAKTQTRSICFGKMLRHHFLKGEVAFQVTCAVGYKKSYPRRWKDSSKIFRPAWHMYFCQDVVEKWCFVFATYLDFIISPICLYAKANDFQDSPSTSFTSLGGIKTLLHHHRSVFLAKVSLSLCAVFDLHASNALASYTFGSQPACFDPQLHWSHCCGPMMSFPNGANMGRDEWLVLLEWIDSKNPV